MEKKDLFPPLLVSSTDQENFNQQYELAKQIGDRRFGSECKHEHTRNGRCLNCLRKVIDRPVKRV